MPRHAVIAIGAALLAAAVVVVEFRMDEPWAIGVLFLVAAVPAAVLFAAGLRERPLADRPRAGTSALLLAGLAVFAAADYRLLQLLGSDDAFDAPRSLTAFFAILTAMALFLAWRSRSAACLLVGALAAGGTLLAAVHWVFDTENIASFRPVLLILAVAFAAAAWAVRDRWRHRDVLVDAAGLSIFAISWLSGGFFFLGGGEGLPDAWEAVLVVGGLCLVAYAALTRAPGPAVIGIFVLFFFAMTVAVQVVAGDFEGSAGGIEEDGPSLVGWPIILLVGALAALAYGLTRRADDDADVVAPRGPEEDPTDVSREVRL
jgi:peptidoglycan/LPS O-acetylase OafA/YrhL